MKTKAKYVIPAICGLIGAYLFVQIYGLLPLNFTYDAWLFDGYVEYDVSQNYAGWLFFRNSPWSFPLGLATDMAYPVGTIISFTDSIPIVAIFFKLLSPILPETFQYFGLYVLLCFVLQGVAAALLISLFTKNKFVIIFGSILFCLSPIMIERAFRHTALASHFLILFSLYLYFKTRRSERFRPPWMFVLLNVLAVGIHPYFLPITFGLTALISLETMLKILPRRRQDTIEQDKFPVAPVVLTVTFFLINIFAVLAFGYVIGIFGAGMSGSGWGFGYFSMNLNAVINPHSLGDIVWSNVFRVRPQTLGNYDGFNYLGAGVIFVALALLVFAILSFIEGKGSFETGGTERIRDFVGRNKFLFLLCFGLSLFALSNVVTYNEHTLLTVPLPESAVEQLSTFRASSRMFYLAYYLIFLSVIVQIMSRFGKSMKSVCFLMSLLLLVQAVDIYPALSAKRNSFEVYEQVYRQGYVRSDFDRIISRFEYFIEIEPVSPIYTSTLVLAAHIGKNQLKTNINIANRRRESKVQDILVREQWFEDLVSGRPDPQIVYAFYDREQFSRLYALNIENVVPVSIEGMLLLIPIRDDVRIPREYIIVPQEMHDE